MAQKSLFKRLFLVTGSLFIVFALLLSSLRGGDELFSVFTVVLSIIFLFVLSIIFWWYLTPIKQAISAIDNGISAFNDNDFSLTVHNKQYAEVSQLIDIYNELATVLRSERMDIFQRELLLDTLIQSTPVAIVLVNSRNNVVYSNLAARELFNQPRKLEGLKFELITPELSIPLRKATQEKINGLVTDSFEKQKIIYHVDCRQFMLNGREHSLFLYKNMTNEISRKESDMWKQVIRLISHELNNSLAPISSLTRSAQQIINQPEHIHMLNEVLETIGKRTKHLHNFISDYAKFARFPNPSIKPVELRPFFEHIERLLEVPCFYDVHKKSAEFDAGQIEQVLINLVKNAKESGSKPEDVEFRLVQQARLLTFYVYDRGTGLTDNQLQQVLLPFFTTKSRGTGIGLALSNEIVNSHNGMLKLVNRSEGGLCVSFSLNL